MSDLHDAIMSLDPPESASDFGDRLDERLDAAYKSGFQAARLAAAELVSAQPAAPALAKDRSHAGPEWSVSADGAYIDSDHFHFDALLRLSGDFADDQERKQYAYSLAAKLNAPDAAPSVAPEPEPEPVAREGGEGWESLAWELCADENGEDACNELIWEGGTIPEPWGDRWMKYEDEAKRLIALVHKHAAHPPRAPLTDEDLKRIMTMQPIYSDDRDHMHTIRMGRAVESAVRKILTAAPAEPKGADGLPVSAPRLYADEEPPEPAAPAAKELIVSMKPSEQAMLSPGAYQVLTDAVKTQVDAAPSVVEPVAWRYTECGGEWVYVGGKTKPTWPWKTPKCEPLFARPIEGKAAPSVAPTAELWMYDFTDDGKPVKDWTTSSREEAFAPGHFNQRRYVPEQPAVPQDRTRSKDDLWRAHSTGPSPHWNVVLSAAAFHKARAVAGTQSTAEDAALYRGIQAYMHHSMPPDAAPSVAPEPQPVAYKVWHREAKHCSCLTSELPTEFRSDTGEPDGYFGGKVQALYEHPPRAPLTDADIERAYRESQGQDLRPQDRKRVIDFARAVIEAAHGIRGQG